MIYYGNELYHHGIKGQKWGIRRFQNKDGSYTAEGKERRISNKEIRKTRNELFRKSYTYIDGEIRKLQNEIEKKRKRAEFLYETYNFDGDDGGGAKDSKSERAGKEYMKIWDEIDSMEDEISDRRAQFVTESLINQYGKERIDKFRNDQDTKTALAIMAPFAAVYISAIGSLYWSWRKL